MHPRMPMLLIVSAVLSSCVVHQVIDDVSGTTWFSNYAQQAGITPDGDGQNTNQFSRDSFNFYAPLRTDALPGGLTNVCRVNSDVANAQGAGDGATLRQWFRDDYVTLDIVGHETTHGVIRWLEANAHGGTALLPYQGESGALNEGLADVMGELIECSTGTCEWLHGEDRCAGAPTCNAMIGCTAPDVCVVRTNASVCQAQLPADNLCTAACDGGLGTTGCRANRSLRNPPGLNDPDHRDSALWASTDAGAFDNGGVHTNSGLMNRVGDLLRNGGTHYGVAVAPIGDLAALLRDTMLTCNATTQTFDSFRDCMVDAAPTDVEESSIDDAWCSVGIPTTDPDCRDADHDQFVAVVDCDDTTAARAPGVAEVCNGVDDNCDGKVDEGSADQDGDGVADCVDPDIDGDCVPNGRDKCATTKTCNYFATDADPAVCVNPCRRAIPGGILHDIFGKCGFHRVPRQCMFDGCEPWELFPRGTDRSAIDRLSQAMGEAPPAGIRIVSRGTKGEAIRVRVDPKLFPEIARASRVLPMMGFGGGGGLPIDACSAALRPVPDLVEASYAACVLKQKTAAAGCNADTDGDGFGDACDP